MNRIAPLTLALAAAACLALAGCDKREEMPPTSAGTTSPSDTTTMPSDTTTMPNDTTTLPGGTSTTPGGGTTTSEGGTTPNDGATTSDTMPAMPAASAASQ